MTAVTPEQARRIAIRAQALDGSTSTVLETVQRLGSLQLDPTARVAPTQFLVLWSRIGAFDEEELSRLLAARELYEWLAFVYPSEALPALLSRMRRWPEGHGARSVRIREWLKANASFRRYVLRELERNGPLPSRRLEDRSQAPWPSTGWTGNRNVGQMLHFLTAHGQAAVVGRAGKQRLFDLAERWYGDVEALPDAEADAYLADQRFRSLGVVHRRGEWVAHADAVDGAVERTTLLSPFDRLIHDRERTEALFGFRYRIEIYVPKAERKHGYFVLPILSGDRLVGRLDPELDRKAGVLRINAVHWEDDPVPLENAVQSLAQFVGAGSITWP